MSERNRGSSFIYVITMVALLAVVSAGFLYLSNFNTRTTQQNQRDLQQLFLAKSIHRAACQAAEQGELTILEAMLSNMEESPEEEGFLCEAETKDVVMELESGEVVTINIRVVFEAVAEDEPGTFLKTLIGFPGNRQYQFCAQLAFDDGIWIVRRHFETEEE